MKIFSAYNGLSDVKKSIIWYTFATVIQKGITFLTTPIYTRLLSDSQYGLYSVYQSWLQIITIVSVIALDRCISVGFVKFEDDKNGFMSSIQLLMTSTVAFFLIIVLVFRKQVVALVGLSLGLVVTMFVVSLFQNSFSNWAWYQRYRYSFRRLTVFTIAFSIISQACSVAAVLLVPIQNKGEILIFTMVVVTVLMYGCVYISVFVKGKISCKIAHLKFALPYSIAILPHALAQIVLSSSDRIMIDKLCGREDAAYYSVSYSTAMVLNVVMISVSSAIQPWFFEKMKQNNHKDVGRATNWFISLSALMAITVSLFAPEVLRILAPSSYGSAIWIFPSVAAAVYFNALYLSFAIYEAYYEKPIYYSIATITGAIVNIVLNLIFIPISGYIAAGYTTLFCYILFAVMHYLFMRKVCKEKIDGERVFDLRFIFILSIVVIGLSVAVTLIYEWPIIRYCLFAMVVIALFIKKNAVISYFRNMMQSSD
jgi:O-antigen/teichoic acid export membrane protein